MILFRLSHMGTAGPLQDWILCQLYEEKLQENMQIVLTYHPIIPEYSCKSYINSVPGVSCVNFIRKENL